MKKVGGGIGKHMKLIPLSNFMKDAQEM